MPSERVIEFYELASFALIGMSKSTRNFAWSIYDQLEELGKRVYAINPKGGVKDGVNFYPSLNSLPEAPEGIIVSVDLCQTQGLLEELKNSGAKYIWFQQGCYDSNVLEQAGQLGLDPIRGCTLMYMPGTPIFHRFHRAINELFGKGYK